MLCVITQVKVNQMIIRTYSELITLPTFKERYQYLKLNGVVGKETFGYDRYLNQEFYRSAGWRSLRDKIIIRDNGCDLGIEDRQVYGRIYIHHLNPLTKNDIKNRSEYLTNPEFLISVSFDTHNAIHYGDEELLLISNLTERTKNDTCPWRR